MPNESWKLYWIICRIVQRGQPIEGYFMDFHNPKVPNGYYCAAEVGISLLPYLLAEDYVEVQG